ncbi:hypothetical protein DFH09DRAFT_1351458 [Mycena vulgaris]|nr:hypothetical protein DFH09DRAFT_1351458 [Mycena vulgaris]
MSKRKRLPKPKLDPSARYKPQLSAEEKASRHRQAVRESYARKPEVRERRRIEMAEKRAAIKANRRRWDKPKPTHVVQEDPTTNFDCQGEESDLPNRGGSTSAEGEVLLARSDCEDIRGERVTPLSDGSVARARTSSQVGRTGADVLEEKERARESHDGAVNSPTSAERVAIEALTALGKPPGVPSIDSVLEKALQLSSISRVLIPSNPCTLRRLRR